MTLDERKGQIKEKYGISHFVDQVVFIRGLDFDFSERDEEMDAYLHSY